MGSKSFEWIIYPSVFKSCREPFAWISPRTYPFSRTSLPNIPEKLCSFNMRLFCIFCCALHQRFILLAGKLSAWRYATLFSEASLEPFYMLFIEAQAPLLLAIANQPSPHTYSNASPKKEGCQNSMFIFSFPSPTPCSRAEEKTNESLTLRNIYVRSRIFMPYVNPVSLSPCYKEHMFYEYPASCTYVDGMDGLPLRDNLSLP